MSRTDINHLDDRELLEHYYADKNNVWLGELLERYSLLLMGVCMKYLKEEEAAKDAVQQVFLKVINELPKYRVEYFKTWMYTIAKNHCLMILRSPDRFNGELNEKIYAAEADTDAPMIASRREETLNALEEAMNSLSRTQRICLELFYFQKKSYRETASETGYSLNEVKSHIQNGKRNLKILLESNRKNEK